MYLAQVTNPGFFTSDYWSAVLQNGIGCALGSLIAIYAAILIYKKTIQEGNKTAAAAQKTNEFNQLMAFALMLQEITKTVETQTQNLTVFRGELKKEPDDFPILKMDTWSNLKRVVDNTSVETTGMAYTKHIRVENATAEFLKIMKVVDFLYLALLELKDIIRQASANHFEREQRFSDVFDSTDEMIIGFNPSTADEFDLYNEIGRIKMKFWEERTKFPAQKTTYEFYLTPLLNLMNRSLGRPVDESFRRKFTYSISKGIEHYGYLHAGYDKFIGEVAMMSRQLEEHLEKLKQIMKNLDVFVTQI